MLLVRGALLEVLFGRRSLQVEFWGAFNFAQFCRMSFEAAPLPPPLDFGLLALGGSLSLGVGAAGLAGRLAGWVACLVSGWLL